MLLVPAAGMLVLGGCGRALKPGDEMVGEITRDRTLESYSEDAEEALFRMGRPVEADFRCAGFALASGRDMAITVESDDFDPVLAVIDREGAVLCMNDDWDGDLAARVVVSELPRGSTLLVFGVDGRGGEFDLSVEEADQSDLDEFTAATSLDSGVLEGERVDDKDDDLMDDLLSDNLEDYVYASSYAGAVIHPFTIEEEQLVSLSLSSNDFDASLALVEIDSDEYEYVGYSDDYAFDTDSRIDQVLEPGLYGAVVMSYGENDDGDYTLTLTRYDSAALEPEKVNADMPGAIFTGTVQPGRGLAAGVWPDITQSKPYDLTVSAATPCAFFEFVIGAGQSGIFDINAGSDVLDTFLTLVRLEQNGTVTYIASNDDASSSTDSKLTWVLPQGTYVAMVSSYDETCSGEVDFSYQPSSVRPVPLIPGRVSRGVIGYDTPRLTYTFDIVAGRSYTVSAEATDSAGDSTIDPFIEAVLPDGTLLTDDDGGGYPNSLLHIYPSTEQAGGVILTVRGLYEGSAGTVDVELSEDRMSDSEAFSLYD